MEKLIYTLQGAPIADPTVLAEHLAKVGGSNIRINLADEDVSAAAALAQQCGDTLPNAVVQCWIPSANPIFRKEIDQQISAVCDHFHCWLVSESTIIANQAHAPKAGTRTYGFAQMAFLPLPQGQSWQDWRAIWRDNHTQIAIDTQSNFEYVQNLVVEPLTPDAPPFVAIVEECFPPEAMSDPTVFFDAQGDQAKFAANLKVMMDSCARFITPSTIDVIPTSQYHFG